MTRCIRISDIRIPHRITLILFLKGHAQNPTITKKRLIIGPLDEVRKTITIDAPSPKYTNILGFSFCQYNARLHAADVAATVPARMECEKGPWHLIRLPLRRLGMGDTPPSFENRLNPLVFSYTMKITSTQNMIPTVLKIVIMSLADLI